MSETEESSVRKGQGPKVAIAQIDPALGDLTANMEKHREAIARAKQEGVDLLVFPELSLTGYRLKDSVPEVALTRQCPELLELGDLSKDLSIVAGMVSATSFRRAWASPRFPSWLSDRMVAPLNQRAYSSYPR